MGSEEEAPRSFRRRPVPRVAAHSPPPPLLHSERRQVRQPAADERVMPHLRRRHGDQAHFDGGPRQAADPQPAVVLAPVFYCFRIEIARLAQRLLAEQLVHERRRLFEVEAVERGAEHALAAPRHLARQPALGHLPQQVLLAEAVQLPARIDLRQEREHVFIEERVARLDRAVHRHAVALGVEQAGRASGTGRSGTARG